MKKFKLTKNLTLKTDTILISNGPDEIKQFVFHLTKKSNLYFSFSLKKR